MQVETELELDGVELRWARGGNEWLEDGLE